MIPGQMRLRFLLSLLLMTPVLLFAASNTAYIHQIPDMTQSEIGGWQYAFGAQYCAPVAASNSFYWLADNKGDQRVLARSLASTRYMHTDKDRGTATAQFLNGVDAMAVKLFGGYQQLEYQGWKRHPRKFSTGIKIPEWRWIIEGVADGSAVWLNVGWYQYDSVNHAYHRVGGHWVTVVGYDDDMLIIHDPAPRAGQSFANEYVHTVQLRGGMLADQRSGLYQPAEGYLVLGTGMHLKSIADVAVVDGAVRFKR
jgi:hypothetical protein